MGRDSRLSCEDCRGRAIALVPRGKGGDDDAAVNGDHRRVRSIVARTTSSVSGGRSPSGTATTPPLRFTSDIGVGTASISIFPSRSVISTALGLPSPARSRSALGITTRPAESMADLMPELYHSRREAGPTGPRSSSGHLFTWLGSPDPREQRFLQRERSIHLWTASRRLGENFVRAWPQNTTLVDAGAPPFVPARQFSRCLALCSERSWWQRARSWPVSLRSRQRRPSRGRRSRESARRHLTWCAIWSQEATPASTRWRPRCAWGTPSLLGA